MFTNNPMVVSEVQTIVGLCDKCNISAFHPKDDISYMYLLSICNDVNLKLYFLVFIPCIHSVIN